MAEQIPLYLTVAKKFKRFLGGDTIPVSNVPTLPATKITEDSTHRFATDAEKTLWNTVSAIVGGSSPDGNSIIDTVAELLAVFTTYPEGTDIATLFASKMAKSQNLNDVADKPTARTNLGLAALATLATVGTSQIDNDSVTYAKMQNVSATARILGRKTAGAGDVEELTLSELLDLIGSPTQGDILFRGSGGWARLPAGTSGDFLKTQGAGANPVWATPSGGGGASSPLTLTASNASEVPLTLKLYATSPTGNFLDFKTNGGTILTSIDKDGLFASTESTSNVHYGCIGTKTGMQIREAQSAGGKIAFLCHYYALLYLGRETYSGGFDAIRGTKDGQFQWSNDTVATATADTGLARTAAKIVKITDGSTGGGALHLQEMTAPSAPATNNAYLYLEDNGSGKSRYMIRFPTGSAVQIAIEP